MVPPPDSDAAEPSLTGQLIAERYRVEQLLGEGGMGAVYRATHVHMHKPVAIKVLHREMTLNEEARMRFEREAVASARIDHPHVTGATDFGKLPDGACYLVLDYVSGSSLKTLLEVEKKFAPGRAVHIVRQIASALDAAHTAGVIHRDLKPDNVMLVEHKGEPDFVKVLDFGIARLESRDSGNTVQLTQAGAVFGTPEYMSPEQAAGNVADGRADLYTIGIILFEMLTGETPFQGETIVSILTQHLTADAPELPDELPANLRRIVRKLLQKDPELRFQTAAELVAALDLVEAPEVARTIPAPALPDKPRAWHALTTRTLEIARVRLWPTLRRFGLIPVELRGHTVPAWQLALGCIALGVLATWLVWPSSDGGVAADEPNAVQAQDLPGTASKKKGVAPPRAGIDLERARAGEANALLALEAMPPDARSEREWAALVIGQFRAGNPKSSLALLDTALRKRHEVTGQPDVLAVAAALALDEATSKPALDRIAESFGERGADLLYAWSKKAPERVDKSFSERVSKALDSAVKVASPALRVAIELDQAKTCNSLEELLPRAQKQADDRASATLQKKTSRRGCGVFNLGDCFKCLRGKSALGDAIASARERPGPEIVEPLSSPEKPEAAASTAPTSP